MKTSTIIFIVICGLIAGALAYFNRPHPAAPVPATTSGTAPEPAASAASENASAPKMASSAPATAPTDPAKVAAASVLASPKTDDTVNPAHKAVDDLLSAKSGLDKHNLFQQIIKSGQIDAVIAELQQRALQDTNNPEIPTTAGEAMLNKVRNMKETGTGDYNQIGIMAMQADQSFNDALKIDPQNWEAQFVKNSSMTYWPLNPEVDNQVVANLSKLIDQQESMTQQPEFSQTFIALGNEYQKLGQPDKAQATWQMGLQKFPNDPSLQKKLNGQ